MNNLNMDERTKIIVDDAVDAVNLFGTLGDKKKECLLIFLKGWDARKNMEELLNEGPEPEFPYRTGAFYYHDGDWIKIRYKGRETEVTFARGEAKSPSKRQQLNELLYQHSMESQVFYTDLLMLLHKEAEENHTW